MCPRRISKLWLSKKQTLLASTAKVDFSTKEPNPNYVKLEAEIKAATDELAVWDAFAAWVKTSMGMTLNQYPLKTASGTYEENQVFVRKNKETGKTTFLTRDQAWAKYEAK